MNVSETPPKLFLRFFRWFCHPDLKPYIEGDLMELYHERLSIYGKKKADIRFIIDVLLLFKRDIIRPTEYSNITSTGMIKNYIKISVRILRQSKSYAFINVAGLALGLAASMIILLIVKNELGYDRFHAQADRTYRVTVHGLDYNPSVSFAVAPAFRNDFPQATYVSQYFYRPEGLISVGVNRYKEKSFAYADDQFPQIFDFNWLQGNPKTALKEPNTVVLTKSIAEKYFGTDDALGKMIRLDNWQDLQVTGVIKDLPSNTHLIFNFLVSWETIRKQAENNNFWAINGGYLYITLPQELPKEKIAAQFPAFIRKNWSENIAKEAQLILQPLTEIHFDQRYLNQVSMPRSKQTVYGLAGVALFIILSACINFVNLATAQSLKRGKEVGVRKTLGAYRKQLISQVLTETTILVMVAVLLAAAAIWTFLPYADSLFHLKVDFSALLTPEVIGTSISVILFIILMAGLYPALVQSGFKPINVLKSGTTGTSQRTYLRRALVVLQFSVTQIVLIGTVIVGSQMDFFQHQSIGFDQEAIITFPTGNNADVLRNKVLAIPGVEDFSFASAAPAYNNNFAPFSSPESGMNEVDVTELKRVDENYLSMFKIKLLAGKTITRQDEKDTVRNVVVNQTLIRRLGVEDPEKAIGRRIFIGGNPAIITGVVQDFQSESKHKKIRACILWYDSRSFWQTSVKLRPRDIHETVTSIEKIWANLNPDNLFSYEFTDDHIAKMYRQEEEMFSSLRLFSGIAILIGALGLYGLVALMGAQRTKEIGIRKVLGASGFSIANLFLKQFVWLILIAFALAAPVAWIAMDKWLNEFAYRIEIGPAIFVASLLVTLLIAGLTIGIQSTKAALINPVKSLKAE